MKRPERLTPEQIDLVLAEVERRAIRARDDAGHGGHHHDGGYRSTMAQLEAYGAGRQGILPTEWRAVHAEMSRDAASERAEYERLRCKYGEASS